MLGMILLRSAVSVAALSAFIAQCYLLWMLTLDLPHGLAVRCLLLTAAMAGIGACLGKRKWVRPYLSRNASNALIVVCGMFGLLCSWGSGFAVAHTSLPAGQMIVGVLVAICAAAIGYLCHKQMRQAVHALVKAAPKPGTPRNPWVVTVVTRRR